MEHYDNECPICLNSFDKGDVYLLNCTHIFHKKCLHSFEKYNEKSIHLCPLCRNAYECILLKDIPEE